MRRFNFFAVFLISLQAAIAQPVPNAWASGTPVQIPSGGVKINGMFFKASGDAPHPTAVYFHGLPGYSGDLDLPLPISRAGWNVLTLHYRGSWGSPGEYSYAHQLEDAAAAIAFVRDPANARMYSIDSRHIVLIGHSTGGLIAMITAAATPGIDGLILISASDDAAEAVAASGKETPASAQATSRPCTGPLSGCDYRDLDLEVLHHASAWTFSALAPRLTKLPILMITAKDPYASEDDALAADLVSNGGPSPEKIHWETDHAYSNQRPALASAVSDWLQKHRAGR